MSSITKHVPPLTQTLYESMACPYSYAKQQIEGRRTPNTDASWRGTEVHHVMAQYAEHCRARKVPADWAAFDRLTATVGNEAGQICDGLRDSHVVDWQHLEGTEWTLFLDESFQALFAERSADAAYKGTLDALYVLEDGVARIDDYKSHPQPFEPDTMQGMLYPLMAFQHFTTLQTVTFRLIFVRYKNVTREITWNRSDLPAMMAELTRARKRQEMYHAIYEKDSGAQNLPVLPNGQCHYCPLLQMGDCPVLDENPHSENPEELVRELQFLGKRRAHITGILKAAQQAKGAPIVAADANGAQLVYGPTAKESTSYPAATLLPVLEQWSEATNDQGLVDGLRISSTTIKGKLAAKKRASLREQVEPLLLKTTKVTTRLSAPKDGQPDEDDSEDW